MLNALHHERHHAPRTYARSGATTMPHDLFIAAGSTLGRDIAGWCHHREPSSPLKSLRARQSTLVLDVGALDGRDAIAFARLGGLPVWSFEASPSKIEPIQQELVRARVRNVTLFPYALANRTGEALYEVRRAPAKKGLAFVRGQLGSATDGLVVPRKQEQLKAAATTAGPPTSAPAGRAVVPVPVRRLDDLVPQGWSVSFLKIDAQGFDFEVLRGAARLLEEGVIERLVFEYHPQRMPDAADAESGLAWLEGLQACQGKPPLLQPPRAHSINMNANTAPRPNIVITPQKPASAIFFTTPLLFLLQCLEVQ